MSVVGVNLSSDFAALVKNLQNYPENPVLKQQVVDSLPAMTRLAEKDPVALYRLAQLYPPNSSQHQSMMQRSAGQGCTQAMLSMASLLSQSGNLVQAAQYIKAIHQSEDSYMKERSAQLLATRPDLLALLKQKNSDSQWRFFSSAQKSQTEAPESTPCPPSV